MAHSRTELHAILKAIPGVAQVYFQPPNGAQIVYPCIMYNWDDTETRYANNLPYSHERRYLVTVIDRNPDSAIPAVIADLPKCAFNRFFTADNLNHFAYSLYF